MQTTANDQASGLRQAAQNSGAGKIPASRKAICCMAVASGKGGVGKTFLAVNLGVAFAAMRKKVLLVDADLGLANADIVLGVNPRFTLQDAIFKGRHLSEVVVPTPYGVDLLSASSGAKEMVSLGQARMSMFINELISFAADYDVLIFDCAAGIDSNVTSFIAATPQTIVVANPQPTSIMDVYALIKLIRQDGLSDNVGLVVNMAESDEQGAKVVNTINAVMERYLSSGLVSLGIVPNSPNARRATSVRKPLLATEPDDIASKRIREIAKGIIQKQTGATRLGNIDGEKLVKGLLRVS